VSFKDTLRAQLVQDEGLKLKVYRCPAGKLTIGVGRNLEDRGISKAEAMLLLENDIEQAEEDARELFPTFESLSDARKAVLCNMALNLGRDRLAGFKRLRAAVADGDFVRAAAEMESSAWFAQVKGRAVRLCRMMKEGV
jgi:lysozyme